MRALTVLCENQAIKLIDRPPAHPYFPAGQGDPRIPTTATIPRHVGLLILFYVFAIPTISQEVRNSELFDFEKDNNMSQTRQEGPKREKYTSHAW